MTDPKVNIKIGTQVRVRPKEEICNHDWVIDDMLKFCGKTLTVVDYEIEKDCVTYLVAETDYGWDESDFIYNSKVQLFRDITKNMADLYEKKNHDYGDSFSKSYSEFGLTSALIRLSDKLNRLKSLANKEAQVKDESIDDTLLDLANYAVMTLVERQHAE